jgi:signal transduction histidine kinase
MMLMISDASSSRPQIEVRSQMQKTLAARLRLALLFGAAVLPLFSLVDVFLFPGRVILLLTFLKIAQAVVLGLLYVALRRRAERAICVGLLAPATGALAAGVTSTLTGDTVFIPLLGSLVTLLSALVFPWGIWPQLSLALIWTAASAWNTVYVTGGLLTSAYPLLVMVVIGVASTVLAYQLERNRCALAKAEAARREEAQISACLAQVGEEMISSVDTQALMRQLSRLTTDALECDFSHTWGRDTTDGAYVPMSAHGETAEGWERLRMVRIPAEMIAQILAEIERERIIDVAAVAFERVLPAPLAGSMRNVGITRALFVALRRGDQLFGIHIAGYRGRLDPFTSTQRRLAAGIAHLASMAIERARLVEELDRTNRVKEHFVATMSHEIRNPLATIIGYGGLLLEGEEFGSLAERQAEAIGHMEAAARQALDVINVTLDMSRFEARDTPVENLDVDPALMLTELANDARAQIQANGVPLFWHTEAALPHLRTDPLKLKMVLRNLIENAIKFTERGRITVAARGRGAGVEFSVGDTGIGIPADAQAAIFKPFWQLQAASSQRGGAGLGLYIVRRLVELLGGTVAVDSELGRGSTFRVWVPCEVQGTKQPAATVDSAGQAS